MNWKTALTWVAIGTVSVALGTMLSAQFNTWKNKAATLPPAKD